MNPDKLRDPALLLLAFTAGLLTGLGIARWRSRDTSTTGGTFDSGINDGNPDHQSPSVTVRWYAKSAGYRFESITRPADLEWSAEEPGRFRYRHFAGLFERRLVGGVTLDARDHVLECFTSAGESGDDADLARVMQCDSLVVP